MIKFLMKTFQTFPSEKNFENWEVFNHDIYLKNTEARQKEIRQATCMVRYNIEKDKKFSWMENYFLSDLKPEMLKGKTITEAKFKYWQKCVSPTLLWSISRQY